MEGLKIVGLCVLASIAYGILHDLVTANLCVEYFSKFHPDVFHTESPLLLALGWGVIATWWMGLILGPIVSAAARSGELPKFTWRDLLKPLAIVLGISYGCAIIGGLVGYFVVQTPPKWVFTMGANMDGVTFTPEKARLFTADLFAHNTSYTVSTIGALSMCVWLIVRRVKLGSQARLVEQGFMPPERRL